MSDNTEQTQQTSGVEQAPSYILTSPSVAKLQASLALAQGEIKNALKDTDNPFYRSKYADLAGVWDACRAPLAKNGLSVIQVSMFEDNKVGVITRLAHSSGEWIEGKLLLPLAKQDAQGYGSAITYARRYSLASIVGVATEDDDGNGASGKQVEDRQAPPPRQQQRQQEAPQPQAPPKDETATLVAELRAKVVSILDPGNEQQASNLRSFWLAFFNETDARKLPRDPKAYVDGYKILAQVLPVQDQENMPMSELAALVHEAIKNLTGATS